MSRIEAIVFDLGNVLLPFDWQKIVRGFSARTGRTEREIGDYFMATPFLTQLSTGLMEKGRFVEVVSRDLGFDGTYDEFALIWSDIFTRNEPMIELAEHLKGKMPRVLLSNTNAIHMDFVLSRYPFLNDFEGLILSHEVGYEKPDRRIYEVTLERFGFKAKRTVFVDDILTNIEAARALGWGGVHHLANEKTLEELTKLGVLPI